MNKDDGIQYYHDVENKKTYALKVDFDKEDLLEVLSRPFVPVNFNLGIACVHPDDNYCKKTGREVSSDKLSLRTFHLVYVDKINDLLYIIFYNKKLNLHIKFRVLQFSNKPHFLCVENDY